MDGVLSDYWCAQTFRAIYDSQCEIQRLEKEKNDILTAPHVVMRPEIVQDGNAFLCLYGDLPSGVVGTGLSPEAACADFDKVWKENAKYAGKQ